MLTGATGAFTLSNNKKMFVTTTDSSKRGVS